MTWTIINFDWNRVRAFLATAEEGSFSAAARALGLTQPTLGRQVAGLESELGVTLFERIGNQLELTETGLSLLEHVRDMREAAERISLTATGQAEALDGIVRITASEAISAYLLPSLVVALRAEHPGIEVELLPSNESTDLRRREADIAVRNFRPQDPELIAKKVRESPTWFYATPEYLDRIGRPDTPEALAERGEILAFDRGETMIPQFNALGFPVARRNFPLRTANHLVQWQLCRQGAGICVMMSEIGDPDPRVERVLPDRGPLLSFPTWLTCHREIRTSRRIRVVFDHLAEGLKHWQPPV